MTVMYNSEDQLVNKIDLYEADMHRKIMGPRHNPISMYGFVEQVEHALEEDGWHVNPGEFVMTKDRQTFFGAYKVSRPEFEGLDFQPIVGLRGSHNQKVSRGMLIGESVIICSNLCFDGDLGNWKTKQTINAWSRQESIINDAVVRLADQVDDRNRLFTRMKEVVVRDRWGDAKLVDLYRKGYLTAAQLGVLLRS